MANWSIHMLVAWLVGSLMIIFSLCRLSLCNLIFRYFFSAFPSRRCEFIVDQFSFWAVRVSPNFLHKLNYTIHSCSMCIESRPNWIVCIQCSDSTEIQNAKIAEYLYRRKIELNWLLDVMFVVVVVVVIFVWMHRNRQNARDLPRLTYFICKIIVSI